MRSPLPLALAAVAALAALAPSAQAATDSQTFSSTGSEQFFTIPAGVSELNVVAVGGKGGGGGFGARVEAHLDVTPGRTLCVMVGGNGDRIGTGGGGFNGGGGSGGADFATPLPAGGGGGATDLRGAPGGVCGSLSSRLIVAGGGGGVGMASSTAYAGGDAGLPGQNSPSTGGGGAGTAFGGGSAGTGINPGGAGSLGSGGVGGQGGIFAGGGGGGGGYFGGGGGGGDFINGAGGGGGSSFLGFASGFATVDSTGVPQMEISWDLPEIDVIPASLGFGEQLVSTPSSTREVKIANEGAGALVVDGLTVSGANASDFSVAGSSCNGSIATGDACTVDVAFTPSATGSRAASLEISSNDAASPSLVPLSGTGIQPAIAVAPATVAFGEQLVSSIGASRSLTVTNSGTGPLNVGRAVISGAADDDYLVNDSGCSGGVAPGGECTITVRFAPTASGARAATLEVRSDAPGPAPSVSLSGTGTEAPPSNSFDIGVARLDRKRGVAQLPVEVPGGGLVSATGSKVKPASGTTAREGTVILLLEPTGKTKRKLRKRGSADVTVTITFVPEGGTARSRQTRLELRRKVAKR